MASMALPSLVSGDGLDRYLKQVRAFPMLEPEEEFMLAKRYQEHDDMSAAHRMVTSHLRLVVKIAQGFRGYGLPLAEMVSEGNIGLMQAVKKFDPERGFRLSTYAMWWIRASIQEYILRSWSLVKVGTSVAKKKLFFNLRKIKHRIGAIEEGDLSPEHLAQIATELDVKEDEVTAMNRRFIASDYSLNAPMQEDGQRAEFIDMLADEGQDQESMVIEADETSRRQSLLQQALTSLKDRERDIFVRRQLKDPADTLEVLSQSYDVSRERVRQIENRAFEKIQSFIASAAA